MLGIQPTLQGRDSIQPHFVNAPAATADTILKTPVVTGNRIYVLSILVMLQGATDTNVTLNSKPSGGSGTAISSLKTVAAGGGWQQTRACESDYLYRTNPGESLSVTLGAGVDAGIDFTYVEAP